jgi:hypothetical protein
MGVLGEAGSLRLLRGEEALLGFGDFEKPPFRVSVTSGHNTILHFNRWFVQLCARGNEWLPARTSGKDMLPRRPAAETSADGWTAPSANLRQFYDLEAPGLFIG